MRVVYFGTYSTGEGYPRNRVLIEGLRRNGVRVEEVNADFFRDAADKIAGPTGVRGRIRTARAWLRLVRLRARCGPCDAVVVGYTGQADLFLARLLFAGSGHPVVLDAFLSLHDTLVRDRGLVREGTAVARLLSFLDRASCRAADLVLIDTRAHAEWFARTTGLPRERFLLDRLHGGEADANHSQPSRGDPVAVAHRLEDVAAARDQERQAPVGAPFEGMGIVDAAEGGERKVPGEGGLPRVEKVDEIVRAALGPEHPPVLPCHPGVSPWSQVAGLEIEGDDPDAGCLLGLGGRHREGHRVTGGGKAPRERPGAGAQSAGGRAALLREE
ncbi:MAG: hypothetical protein MUE73_02950 [Planctomycetes bacterium]|jgi:hypothetical protein|nr:hypothetical protein [Planctomycetota bacterium]